MKLRIHRRWEYGTDPYDPRLTWSQVDVLQFQDAEHKWHDVPIVDEGKLTEALKKKKVPRELRWRINR